MTSIQVNRNFKMQSSPYAKDAAIITLPTSSAFSSSRLSTLAPHRSFSSLRPLTSRSARLSRLAVRSAICVRSFFSSVAWPYVKLSASLAIWFAPECLVPLRVRNRLVLWFDALAGIFERCEVAQHDRHRGWVAGLFDVVEVDAQKWWNDGGGIVCAADADQGKLLAIKQQMQKMANRSTTHNDQMLHSINCMFQTDAEDLLRSVEPKGSQMSLVACLQDVICRCRYIGTLHIHQGHRRASQHTQAKLHASCSKCKKAQ